MNTDNDRIEEVFRKIRNGAVPQPKGVIAAAAARRSQLRNRRRIAAAVVGPILVLVSGIAIVNAADSRQPVVTASEGPASGAPTTTAPTTTTTAPPSPLGDWVAESFVVGNAELLTAESPNELSIFLDANGSLAGDNGCNSWSGQADWSAAGDISMTILSTTDVGCASELPLLFNDAISATNSWSIDDGGNRLSLRGGAGEISMRRI